ncbi:MAG: chitobiase/beta-hexosaminidase C-terminal domain-containing protein, partial [Balneolales bacterium]|nr:chitobiase/beta-hexosaminidase C-terminal domain-containing protein [Balneolales bacterium]
MNKLYKICAALLLTMTFGAEAMFAQATPQQVSVRDLHAYDVLPSSQADLPGHPLTGQLVTFDAVVVSAPKNSGLATVNDGVPGRIHVFVADVNAIEDGRNGMYIQIVVDGARRETLEALLSGDVIRVEGDLRFFGNGSQFNASEVTLLGSIALDAEYADLSPLLEPEVVSLTDINIPSTEGEGLHRWNANAYSNYIHSYVKIEGLEVIDRVENPPNNRPWIALTDGTSIIYTTDTSLRFRNDRGDGYAYNPETGQGLGYNWRRLAEELDGPYVPPVAGSIVDISGFILVNEFNPAGYDVSTAQSTLKIAPWDDGVVWTQDGTDTDFRFTEGVNNDLVVLGFPALVDNLVVTPGDEIDNATQATISVDVILPEDTYTLESVSVAYRAIGFDEDTSDLVTETMTGSGDTYTFTFPAFPDFTRIEYTVNAVSTTPDNVETVGRLNGSIFVNNEDFTVPPRFSPPAGTYANQVAVTMSTPTTGATIYYTTDGSEPDETSDIYGGSALTFDQTTTIRAYADVSGKQASPMVTRQYVVEQAAVEVSTLADLRAGSQDGTVYLYTGEAVVVYTQNNRNQKFLMDETAGILIDDLPGTITSAYAIGDVVTNLLVTVTNFRQLTQVIPQADPGAPTSTKEIV